MKTRQILILLLALLLCLTCLACTPQENNPPAPGTTDAGETTDASSETTGNAVEPPPEDVPGYTYTVEGSSATITGYTGDSRDLVLPSYAGGVPVTAVAPYAFAYRAAIESVVLPGSLQDTGENSFIGCSNLKKIVLSEGITEIARGTFNDCPSLSEITFPSTLRVIGIVAFQGSEALKSVSLPDALTAIGYRAFANSGLTSVVVPAACKRVDGGAFANCRALKSCEIRGPITRVSMNLFRECLALETVVLPMSVTTVDDYAFYRCVSLKELDLGMTDYLCTYALWGCTGLEKVYLHTTKMDRISVRAIAFTPNLKNIYYAGTMDSWTNMRLLDGFNDSLSQVTINADWNGQT
ncbi:MAG: leucine-rich repeat protein [Clostridia bacterium]|nr:leucine-rich repeat protein [Clostridia bacterium]